MGFSACSETDTSNSNEQSGEVSVQTKESSSSSGQESTSTSTTVSENNYGSLQELVDTYGLPINLWRIEGVTLTKFELSEDSAKREWMSNNDQKVKKISHGILMAIILQSAGIGTKDLKYTLTVGEQFLKRMVKNT